MEPRATVLSLRDVKDAFLAGLSTKEQLVLSVASTSVRREVLSPLLRAIGELARGILRREEAREAGEWPGRLRSPNGPRAPSA